MTRFFVRHPVTTWMIFLAFAVLAVYALPRIEIEALPEVDLPSLTVTTRWQGASPKAVQRALTRPDRRGGTQRPWRRVGQVDQPGGRVVGRGGVSPRRGSGLRAPASQRAAGRDPPRPAAQRQPAGHPAVRARGVRDPAVLHLQRRVAAVSERAARAGREVDRAPGAGRRRRRRRPGAGRRAAVARDRARPSPAGPLPRSGRTRSLPPSTGSTSSRAPGRFARRAREARGVARARRRRPHGEAIVGYRGRAGVRTGGARRGAILVRGSRLLRALERPQRDSDPGREAQRRQLGRCQPRSAEALPRIEARTPSEVVLRVDEDEGRGARRQAARAGGPLDRDSDPALPAPRPEPAAGSADRDRGGVDPLLAGDLSEPVLLPRAVGQLHHHQRPHHLLRHAARQQHSGARRHPPSPGRARASGDAGLNREAARALVAAETIIAGTKEVLFPILATTVTTMVAFLSFIFLSGRLALYYVPLAISIATAMFASVFVAFGWIPVVLNQVWVPRVLRRQRQGERISRAEEIDEYLDEAPDLDAKPRGSRAGDRLEPPALADSRPGLAALFYWGASVYQDDVIKGGFFRMPDQEKLIFFMRMAEGTDVEVTSETMLRFEGLLLPIHDGAEMRSTVFGNQAYMEVEFDDYLLTTGIPLLYRSLLVELADETGGTAIFISGFDESPYFKGNLMGSALNSLVKITGYNSKRLTEIAEQTLRKVERNRRVRNPRITGSERFGRSTNEETLISLRRDVLADHGLTVLEVVSTVRRLLGLDTPWSMLVNGEQKTGAAGVPGRRLLRCLGPVQRGDQG